MTWRQEQWSPITVRLHLAPVSIPRWLNPLSQLQTVCSWKAGSHPIKTPPGFPEDPGFGVCSPRCLPRGVMLPRAPLGKQERLESGGPRAAVTWRSCCLLQGFAQSLLTVTLLSAQNNSCRARRFAPCVHGCCCTENRRGTGVKTLNQEDRNRNGKVYNRSTWHRAGERRGKLQLPGT